MELNEYLKSKARFHLGFNAGAQIPAGDRARLEEAMALIPDEYWYEQVVNHIRRCDTAWDNSEYFPTDSSGSPNYSRLEQIAGDVQRTIATSDPLKGDEFFREIYLREVDRYLQSSGRSSADIQRVAVLCSTKFGDNCRIDLGIRYLNYGNTENYNGSRQGHRL